MKEYVGYSEVLPTQEVLKFTDFNKIVLVDDKSTTLVEISELPPRGDYYLQICKNFSKLGMDNVDIVLVVGDGLFTYNKTDKRLIKDDSIVASFPSSASDSASTEQLSDLVISQKEKNTLFIVDNRLADDETNYNNGIFSRNLLEKINNAGGYTIRTSGDSRTNSPYITENKKHLGFAREVSVFSSSIFAKTIEQMVNRATQA